MGTDIKIPEDVSRETLAFAQRILGPVADAAEFLGDKIRFYRWKSAQKTLEKAAEILKVKGIEPKEVPVKFLVPFLEKCSLEEPDSDLQDDWAHLLAAASEEYDSLQLAFVEVLSQIGPDEAKIMRRLAENTPRGQIGNYIENREKKAVETRLDGPIQKFSTFFDEKTGMDEHGRMWTSVLETASFSRHASQILSYPASDFVYILQRLGLIQVFDSGEKKLKSDVGEVSRFAQWIRISTFGFNFVAACQGKEGVYTDSVRRRKNKGP